MHDPRSLCFGWELELSRRRSDVSVSTSRISDGGGVLCRYRCYCQSSGTWIWRSLKILSGGGRAHSSATAAASL